MGRWVGLGLLLLPRLHLLLVLLMLHVRRRRNVLPSWRCMRRRLRTVRIRRDDDRRWTLRVARILHLTLLSPAIRTLNRSILHRRRTRPHLAQCASFSRTTSRS